MQRPDTPDGLFHDGNPNTGVKGTPITAALLNQWLQAAIILSGTTEPPAAGLGGDNDLYLCIVSRNMYGPKTNGEWGAAWAQGIPGARGFRWYWGEVAPGAIIGQLDNDFYLQISSGDVWQLLVGVWGKIGNIRGSSVLSGQRDPIVSDGRAGDWWINSLTLTIYGPKVGDSWGLGQAMRGPQGIQGAPGPAISTPWADVQTHTQSMALNGYDCIYRGDTTSGALIWTAPVANGNKGRQLYVENVGSAENDLTLNASNGETIEGEIGILLSDGIGMKFYSDGLNWLRLKL